LSIGEMFDHVMQGVDKAADAETRIGRSTWTRTLGSKAIGLFFLVLSMFYENWEIALPGLLIIGIALYFLLRRFFKTQKAKAALKSP
jgi:hypothetical protein